MVHRETEKRKCRKGNSRQKMVSKSNNTHVLGTPEVKRRVCGVK